MAEIKCPACDGTGEIIEISATDYCWVCGGRRTVTTERLSMIRRVFIIKMREEKDAQRITPTETPASKSERPKPDNDT